MPVEICLRMCILIPFMSGVSFVFAMSQIFSRVRKRMGPCMHVPTSCMGKQVDQPNAALPPPYHDSIRRRLSRVRQRGPVRTPLEAYYLSIVSSLPNSSPNECVLTECPIRKEQQGGPLPRTGTTGAYEGLPCKSANHRIHCKPLGADCDQDPLKEDPAEEPRLILNCFSLADMIEYHP